MPFIKNTAIQANKIPPPPEIKIHEIDAGADSSHAINSNGIAWGWGNNGAGRLGDNSITNKSTPVSVSGVTKTFCKIATGFDHTIALEKNGQVWAWGNNGWGQLGDNTTISKTTPVQIAGVTKTFCQISTGYSNTAAVDKNGGAWGWGRNGFGEVGDNTIISRSTPVAVAGATKTFCQISAGGSHTLAIDKNGRAWGWGAAASGRLGDNSITNKSTPVSVLGAVKTFCQISAGGSHSLAIDQYGQAWAWGYNVNGQLGNGGSLSRRTPVLLGGIAKTFCQISAGVLHCAAIDKYGKVWTWGANVYGQLGNNSVTSQRTPVSVVGTNKTFCKISVGNSHTIAIDKDGNVWAWGINASGQLGDNSITSRLTPVRVCNI